MKRKRSEKNYTQEEIQKMIPNFDPEAYLIFINNDLLLWDFICKMPDGEVSYNVLVVFYGGRKK